MKHIGESFTQGSRADNSYWYRVYSVTEEELEMLKEKYPDASVGKVYIAPKYHNYDYGYAEKSADGFEGYGIDCVRVTYQTYHAYILESTLKRI